MSDELVVQVDDGIAVLTMNRPDRRNALNTTLRHALDTELRALDADDEVRAVILTGTDPAFCGGLDLKDLEQRAGAPDAGATRGCPIPDLSKPLIGAVNGPAVTGGLEVALRCHVLVASERATFADTHAKVGLISTWGLATLLPLAVGPRKAREMSMTGAALGASDALACGLVQHVVPHDELLSTAIGLAQLVKATQPGAIRRMLELYDEVSGLPRSAALAHEDAAGTAWATEVVAAVLARRRQDSGT